jgi:hypothetical protein
VSKSPASACVEGERLTRLVQVSKSPASACVEGERLTRDIYWLVQVSKSPASACLEGGRLKMRNLLADLFENKTYAFNRMVRNILIFF